MKEEKQEEKDEEEEEKEPIVVEEKESANKEPQPDMFEEFHPFKFEQVRIDDLHSALQ